jgi:RNA polymerase sigma-70 factor (ECF subfamily)
MQLRKSKFSIYSDEELMLHICNGEELAFEEIYSRYGKRLLGYFIRMLNFDKMMAEDALQDVFLKLAEAPEKFDNQRSFETWIFSIASNYCKNYYRHKKVILKNNEETSYFSKQINENAFLKLADKIDAVQFKKMLEEILNELPAEKKEAFILKYQEDKGITEIAFIQNCPEGSVKSRLHYTLKILEEKLKLFNPKI